MRPVSVTPPPVSWLPDYPEAFTRRRARQAQWADRTNGRLRLRLIGVVVLILIAGFAATSAMSYRDAARAMRMAILHNELPLTGSNVYSEVHSDLVRPFFIASQMANDTFLKDWLLSGEQGTDRIIRYLDTIHEKYSVFTSFLISDATRTYYRFSGVSGAVDPQSPDDSWYFRVKDMTAPYEINIDYDQASNRTVTIFVNHRVLGYDGKFIGVTGVGLNLGSVQRIVERYHADFHRNVYFVDRTGTVTITPAGTLHTGDNIATLPGLATVASRVLGSPEGQFEYQRNGDTWLIDSRFIPELGWYLVVEQPEADAIRCLWTSLTRNLWVGLGIIFLTGATIAAAVTVYHRKLDAMATTDKLTGLANRQVFDVTMRHLLKSRRRGRRPFALLLCDIDHFKRINDTLGHLRGDDVIRRVAQTTLEGLRETDLVCRWGGEELIILASNCDLHDACDLAESLRGAIADRALFVPDDGTRVTVSVGVTAHETDDTIDTMLARVDKALYRAKREGRNCVRAVYAPTATSPELLAAE